jgi:hypothetical protein
MAAPVVEIMATASYTYMSKYNDVHHPLQKYVYFYIQITITVSRAVTQAALTAEGMNSAQSTVLI